MMILPNHASLNEGSLFNQGSSVIHGWGDKVPPSIKLHRRWWFIPNECCPRPRVRVGFHWGSNRSKLTPCHHDLVNGFCSGVVEDMALPPLLQHTTRLRLSAVGE